MTEQNEKKNDQNQIPPQQPGQKRQLIISTDGNNFKVEDGTNVTPLEMKAICRDIVNRLGG